MKAVIFEKSGLENLKISEVKDPEPGHHDVVLRVIESGVNPIDYFVVSFIPVQPMPHIPGAEIYGEVVKVGEHVKSVKPGDKVVVYNRVFDGNCDMCLRGNEELCRNGGIMSLITQGGWAEKMIVPEKNVVKVDLEPSLAASLPVAGLTSYHALKEAGASLGKTVVVFGASGNTGMFAVQLAKKMGSKVIAVSRKSWVKDFGADAVVESSKVVDTVRQMTNGKMADIVINSVGASVWDISMNVLGPRGKLVLFGTLTGGEVKLDLSKVYSLHSQIVGTTGGTRAEIAELAELCKDCKVKVYKKYPLEEAAEALKALMSGDRDGRIMIKV
ncbi:alcohol dehydrogenase catalytic domain-containing protein [Metallosphaera tengchongensis]|uniref:Alcohol dehydrogenase catalytic domain-containing protein n=1 Tax=Metallosphaera tengchongensis TaxID=1532350 RepID=A0A6N0NU93_9CREN|nr:alcohol dehydrogenase catalytic domain-containing protein [Metallosphaera tengchongensis]QKQ99037.1 alcohol dehydrogenase catalytic domain-containing protein [Metallosphaera tengchongensis]